MLYGLLFTLKQARLTPNNYQHDPELEDAKWVTLAEVKEALRVGTSGLGEEAGEKYQEGGLRLPPRTAIANQLLSAVTDGFLGSGNEGSRI